MRFYKVLDESGGAIYGTGWWALPDGDQPGAWMPRIEGDLVACKNGYHLCTRETLIEWLGPRIFEVEPRDTPVEQNGKLLCREARLVREFTTWNERTARLFAADCAERVLPRFENNYPNDSRPRQAIEAARAYARGNMSTAQLQAAGVAARIAAKAAAARVAAKAAAEAAARAAAGNTAGVAAWAAAGIAARAAAGVSARAAAGTAARVAAWASAREWHTAQLWSYLEGKYE